MTTIDTAELERLDDILRDPLSGLTWDNRIMAADAIHEVLARRKAEDWRPETNILPWVALTIEQMRRFEASSGDIERLGLNGEWIPTDTPLSPGLVYRIKPTPTTEASHDE